MNSNQSNNGLTGGQMTFCYKCNSWYNFNHTCNPDNTLISYGKSLSSYTLEELFTELKRRQKEHDAKVTQLQKELELQKELDRMFPKE